MMQPERQLLLQSMHEAVTEAVRLCMSHLCFLAADPLRKIAGEHPGVSIGSYPNVAECGVEQSFRVRLQLESRDEAALHRAVAAVREGIACSEAAGA
jgi:molybdopterin-biosynthesis enzyme MoeA-like protein